MARLSKLYTRAGDGGATRLGAGTEVAKDSLRVEAYGTVDELSSCIGQALAVGVCERLSIELAAIQNQLFDLGGDLATPESENPEFDVPAYRGAARRRTRGADRRADRGCRAARELHPAGWLARCGSSSDGTNRLSPGGAASGLVGAGGGHRRPGGALSEPSLRRAVRNGAFREPRSRRRRAVVAAGTVSTSGSWNVPGSARRALVGCFFLTSNN